MTVPMLYRYKYYGQWQLRLCWDWCTFDLGFGFSLDRADYRLRLGFAWATLTGGFRKRGAEE